MTRVRSITYKGRSVMLLDFTGVATPADWTAAVAEVRSVFAALPADGSALTLTDISDTKYNRHSIELMKALTADNRARVRAGAVVNRSAMHRAVIGMIGMFARRKFEVFETRELALDWLVTQ